MTRFIPSFATQQLLPPWNGDAEIYAFAFEMPTDIIQDYVDKYFNSVDNRDHRFAFTQMNDYLFGLLIYSRFTNIKTLPTHKNGLHPYTWDNVDFNDVGVYFPTSNRLANEHNITRDHVQWCQPLALCDNHLVTFSAREIVGLDMLPGKISAFPGHNPRVISAKLYGVDKFSPTSKEREIDFLDIELTESALSAAKATNNDTTESNLGDESSSRSDMMWKIHELSGGKSLGNGCLPQAMNIVSLKQFRDASNMNVAIYQALVQFRVHRELTPSTSEPTLSFIPEKEVKITLARNDTTDEIVTSILGQTFPDATQSSERVPVTITPTLAFRLNCRVVMDKVTTDILLS